MIESTPVYAVLISVVLLYYNIKAPVFIENTAFLLAYSTIAMILMSLGIALTKLKVFSFKNAIISTFARLFLGPIIGLLIIYLFDLSGVAAGVLFIQTAMPSAILTYLLDRCTHQRKQLIVSRVQLWFQLFFLFLQYQ